MAASAPVTILVPYALRDTCRGEKKLLSSAATVREVLLDLEREEPLFHRSICDETGAVRRHVNVFVNDSHVRELRGLDTALVPGDSVTILPAVSGG